MFLGFQSNGFQHSGYQIPFSYSSDPPSPVIENSSARGDNSYRLEQARNDSIREAIRQEQIQNEKNLARQEKKLAAIEAKRKERLDDIKLQKQLMNILQEIRAEETLRANLQRRLLILQDEDDFIVLLTLALDC